jgi:hypothetical protein
MQWECRQIDFWESFDPQPCPPRFRPVSTGNRFIAEVMAPMEGVSDTSWPDDDVLAVK